MPLTVAEALGIYPFSQSNIIAGMKGVDRWVTAVNVMDAPDIIDWVKPGELLLTTAYAIRDRLDQGPEIVAGLASKGCAGLAIKLGRFLDAIPREMVQLADQEGFPLIALPFEYTLADQMNALFPLLLDARPSDWAEWMRRSQVMTTLMHEDLPLSEWFVQLGRALPCPIYMESTAGESTRLNAKTRPAGSDRFAVRFHDHDFGWMHVDSEESSMPSAAGPLFQQAAALLGWRINMEISELSSTIWEYFRHPHDHVNFHNQLEQRGWKFPTQYRMVLSWVGDDRDGRAAGAMAPVADRPALISIEKILRTHPKMARYYGSHFRSDNMILSILDVTHHHEIGRELATVLNEIYGQLRSSLGKSVAVVLSDVVTNDTTDIAEAFRELWAYAQSYPFTTGGGVAFRRPWDLADLFSGMPPTSQIALAHQTLGPLLNNDPYSQELYSTLRTFLESDGQPAVTAKKLYVHRNTVTYRLDKIAEILRCDLHRLDTLLLLRMALHFWEGHQVRAGA